MEGLSMEAPASILTDEKAKSVERGGASIGPFLQFLGTTPEGWRGSILLVAASSQPPQLRLVDGNASSTHEPQKLDTLGSSAFWRWDLLLPLQQAERKVGYSIPGVSDKTLEYNFFIPGAKQPWHWAFHSCNGLSANVDRAIYGGVPPLWRDVLKVHAAKPMHMLAGGGDQIYNDGVWLCAPLKAWLDKEDNSARYGAEFDPEMEDVVSRWYFDHYVEHFSIDIIKDAFASIPQVNIWDDHDIFDGWGSYPDELQGCKVFQGVYSVARRFYLLFQHHTTPAKPELSGLFGSPGTFSFLRQLGPSQAVLAPDARGERTKKHIITPASYDMLFSAVEQLPSSVRHLVLILGVPIVYPNLPFSQAVLGALDGTPVVKGLMQKTGVGAGILDKFGRTELLDDIVDHWDAKEHHAERKAFILRLQDYAKARSVRVSFIAGDVHCCGVGRLYSYPKLRSHAADFRFMPQIVSSAIANPPPPAALITLLQKLDRAKKLDLRTKEKMVRIFRQAYPDTAGKLLGRRNWCEVRQETVRDAAGAAGAAGNRPEAMFHHFQRSMGKSSKGDQDALVFSLRVEDPDNMDAPPAAFDTVVPALVVNEGIQEKTERVCCGLRTRARIVYHDGETANPMSEVTGRAAQPAGGAGIPTSV